MQVCWEKAARYLDVEERYVNITEDRFVLDPKETIDKVDENVRNIHDSLNLNLTVDQTILVCVILGTTYTVSLLPLYIFRSVFSCLSSRESVCFLYFLL